MNMQPPNSAEDALQMLSGLTILQETVEFYVHMVRMMEGALKAALPTDGASITLDGADWFDDATAVRFTRKGDGVEFTTIHADGTPTSMMIEAMVGSVGEAAPIFSFGDDDGAVTIDQYQDAVASLQEQVVSEGYFVSLYDSVLTQSDMTREGVAAGAYSPSALTTMLNEFWEALPDDQTIHREPFMTLCDLCTTDFE